MILTISILSIFIFRTGCKKEVVDFNAPPCINSTIQQNINTPDWEVGYIEEYQYQGKLVYAFQPDLRKIADGATDIFNDDCVKICSVGGFAGQAINQCNGENWYQKAVLVREVWRKP